MKDLIHKISYILDYRQKWELVFLLLCMVVNAAFELLGIGVIYPVIDLAMNPDTISSNPLYIRIYVFFGFSSYQQFVLALVVFIVVLFTLKTAFLLYFRWLQLDFQYRNQGVISSRLLAAYMAQPYSFFAQNNSATLIQNVYSNVESFLLLLFYVLQIVIYGFTALCIGAMMFTTNTIITAVLLGVISMLVGLYFFVIKKKLLKYGKDYRRYSAMMIQWLNQSIGGIKETKVLQREKFFIENYDRNQKRYAVSMEMSQLLSNAPNDVLLSACICTVFVMLGFLLLKGKDISTMVTGLAIFALAAFRIFPCISSMSSCVNKLFFYTQSVDAVYRILSEADSLEKKNSAQNVSLPEKLLFEDTIALRDVSFGYEGTAGKVFEHADIEIPKNASVAFIGPSGAGKTTAADIILGLLDPIEGAVLVDGMNICGHKSGWLKNVGYIPQVIYLSDDTIRANIAFGLPPEATDDDKVWRAAEQAQLAEYIRSLPNGLDTYVGERGIRMSGGQRQRVGIARALYNDPEVLVLDEATSALDTETETAVMEAIDGLSGQKTLLIIAHRLTTIRNCDIVYEIKDGRVTRTR
ncbi:MAG: ABC transporter ATP-binding protein [Ruminococcus sp.]|nr:ABC transporter ATP-binding protein [Ruminococcus sp.]